MAFLKDPEKEKLKELVKACLLEISELKIKLDKCEGSSKTSQAVKDTHQQISEKDGRLTELDKIIDVKNEEITKFKNILKEKDTEIAELKKIKTYFEALTAKPKKDLTSFQSQVYQLLPGEEGTMEDLHSHITNIAFHELSSENFNHILRNLERKGYFKSSKKDGKTLWRKILK
ncbi:MAG: hypothetical protein FJ150_05475 [Euryarchaeota archaeon]|nr:hypothetical protein [Euryarchaeota archaeon]